ncbi:3-oxoacyl-[acyl-carrier-protein] reductase [Intestinibacillus sp. Marseille-P6563]|uniref:3-oxoacyl-[acyl-carrier-protein] reductase n=1 Tax=Intestinibacillus sp. Marseille-P6563 TaxID=2364792 RepID=UPI000F04A364|nr:3-oxoacyl-[acyl-carrier-protein] reductase [Intestinibacillus sp. Marseille-P6563]
MGIAIVTGGSRGIGAAIARRLAQAGHDIVVNCASSVDKAEKIAEECRALGVNAMAMQWDVSDHAACEQALAEIKEKMGVPYILVNNAGITRDGLMVRMKEEQFDDVIRINLKGAYNMLQLCGAMMMRAKKGRIINISSISGMVGNFGQINYCAAKAGLIGMTKTAAKELGARGITVNAVAPGFIDTDMTAGLAEDLKEGAKKQIALGRFGKPEEIAAAVAFLASDEASFITSQTLVVDGGMI